MYFLGSQALSWQHTYTEQEHGRAVQTHVYACGCVHTFAHGVVHACVHTTFYGNAMDCLWNSLWEFYEKFYF